MAKTHVKSIPLSDLKVSKLNMRHGRKKPDITDILPSIRTHGIRQSLLVRAEGDKFGVIAGRRRLFALKEVAKETGKDPRVPCIVMNTASEADAIEASLIENVARMPATEMEQYTSFSELNEAGRGVDEIAEYYGITPLTVKRVLALANLIEPIRKAYSDDEIDRKTIRALTLATPEQQKEWLALFQGEGRAPRGRACRAWITGGDVITTDKALFDLATYGGTVVTDLFGDHGVFADAASFWRAQSMAISTQVDAYGKAGWNGVHVLERGAYFQSWEHEKCARTKGGHVFIELRHNGEVVCHEGYITKAEAKRRKKTGSASTDSPTRASEMSGTMATYIARHRHAAAGASLLKAPSIALRLMVAHAMTGSALWSVKDQPDNIRKETTAESIANSKAICEITKANEAVSALFNALDMVMPNRCFDDIALCRTFSALFAMSDEELLAVLSLIMARTLAVDSPIIEALLHVLSVDMSGYWSPDEAFFELLRDKQVINSLLAEVTSDDTAKTMLSETGKAQKDLLKAEAAPEWRPGWMQVPPTSVRDGAKQGPVGQWNRVSGLFEDAEQANSASSNSDNIAA